jgi:hypothetical protein
VRKNYLSLLCILLLLGASACADLLPTPAASPLDTATPAQTLSPTPTIVWFPATNTPTPVPTVEIIPTEEKRPGQGAVFLSDDFSANDLWPVGENPAGSVAYSQNQLTLAIAQPKGTLSSLRSSPELDNFYLEMTINISLCKGADAYGLLLRAESPQNGYRFLIGCDGRLRLERLKGGQVLPLQDWTPSGQVPPGSPLVLHVGVWAFNSEMRFFINDIYQFNITDPVWSSGKIGIYARSAGDTAVTVSFSQLEVRDLQVAATPTPTVTPTATPKAPKK